MTPAAEKGMKPISLMNYTYVVLLGNNAWGFMCISETERICFFNYHVSLVGGHLDIIG